MTRFDIVDHIAKEYINLYNILMKITVMTIFELAKYLNISQRSLKRWEKKGLPVVRISPYLRRYILEDVLSWMEEVNRLADDFS